MQSDKVYQLTSKGKVELGSGTTRLPTDELDLLVRIDGNLSVQQIKNQVPLLSDAAFSAIFGRLIDMDLVTIVEFDPFATQFQFPSSKAVFSDADADSGVASLKRSGYFVSIARNRRPARSLSAGEQRIAVVVEDDPMLAKFIETYLSLDDFVVRVAGNRAEVLTALRTLPVPDLVLLDVMLPDTNGFDILLRMRQHAMLKNVPIIMLTGKATREDVLKGLAGDADGYVTKPFEADVLMHAVNTVLGLSSAAPSSTSPKDPWGDKRA